MPRLIDADEAYKVLTDYYHHGTEIQHKTLKEAFERVPTVDIDAITESHEKIGYDKGYRDGYAQATSEVRHGRWILNKTSSYGTHCDCCGWAWSDHIDAIKLKPILSYIKTNYCPNCGAKMDEVRIDDVVSGTNGTNL